MTTPSNDTRNAAKHALDLILLDDPESAADIIRDLPTDAVKEIAAAAVVLGAACALTAAEESR